MKGGLMSKKSTRRLSQIIHRFISFKNNHGNNDALQSFQSSKAGSASPEERGFDTEGAPNGQASHPIFFTDRSQIIFVKNNQAKTMHYKSSSSPSADAFSKNPASAGFFMGGRWAEYPLPGPAPLDRAPYRLKARPAAPRTRRHGRNRASASPAPRRDGSRGGYKSRCGHPAAIPAAARPSRVSYGRTI